MDIIDAGKIFAKSCRGLSPVIECPFSLSQIQQNARQAIKNAEQARTSVQKFDDALATRLSYDPAMTVVMGPVKEEERIIQKAISRYDGDVSQVSDVSRSRIRLQSPSDVKKAKDILASENFRNYLHDKGIKILGVEDFYETPKQTGWRGLVVKIEVALGKGRTQKSETVLLPNGWFPDYETTHRYFENGRALKDLAKAQNNRELSDDEKTQIARYDQMSKEIHDRLAHRDGYAALETKPRVPFRLVV